MNRTVEFKQRWDAEALLTVDLTPAGASAALIDFPFDPEQQDAGLPESVAGALAKALVRYGDVAGRWLDDAPPPADAEVIPATEQGAVRSIWRRVLQSEPAKIVATRSTQDVITLLSLGWWVQQQALLVLDPDSSSSRAEAFSALGTTADWRGFTFPEPCLALIAPGVDGDYILVAAATKARRDHLLDLVAAELEAAGFLVLRDVATGIAGTETGR